MSIAGQSLSNETDQYNPIISVRIKRFANLTFCTPHHLPLIFLGHAHCTATSLHSCPPLVHFFFYMQQPFINFFRAHIPLEPIHDKNCTAIINPFARLLPQLFIIQSSPLSPSVHHTLQMQNQNNSARWSINYRST